MKLKNPFLIRGYAGAEYFCDREKETQKLISAFENDRDVTLIAPRRFGKTGLIHHTFSHLPEEYVSIYLDIFSTRTLSEFTSLFASAVIGALDTKIEAAMSAVTRFFRSCRPSITPQEDGMPKFSFDIAPSAAETTLKEVFAYLKLKERRVVVAIDEFQQVAEYPEKGVEALLRSEIQFLPNVRFVFAGSRKHMMEEMFASPKRPFYQSTQIMSLREIPCEAYAGFAEKFFKDAGRSFNPDAFSILYNQFEGITWYVQAVMNRIWGSGDGLAEKGQIDAAVDSIVEDHELLFYDLLRSQSDGSQTMLRAIANVGAVSQPTSGDFVANSGLRAASSAAFALNDLKNRDLVYETESGWTVYDRLFGIWLKKRYGLKLK